MNDIKAWAMCFCAASLLLSILHFFTPQKRFDSILKPVFAAFLMLLCSSILVAKKDSDFSLRSSLTESTAPTSQADSFASRAIINSVADALKDEIGVLLSNKKIAFENVEVSMNISPDDSIVINEIAIEGVPEEKRQIAHDLIQKRLGLEVILR